MEDSNPSEFFINQNTPNPFCDSTHLQYYLPKKSKVKLSIYNIENKRVKKLVNGIQQQGTYDIKLQGKQFLGNCYYYEFIATKPPLGLKVLFNQMKRMSIIR
jgi:hypothetical protein